MKRNMGFLLVLLLSGCSLFTTNYDSHSWIQEFGSLIEQDNQNDKQLESIGKLNEEIQTLAATGNSNKIDRILTLIQKEKEQINTYLQSINHLQQKVSTLSQKGEQLESDKTRNLANQSIRHFQQVLQIESDYAKLLNQSFTTNHSFFMQVKKDSSNWKSDENMNMKQIEQKINQKEKQLTQAIQNLNQSNQKFQKHVQSMASK